MRRQRCALLRLDRAAAGERLERREALAELVVDQHLGIPEVLRVALAPQRLVDVDVLLEGQRRIERDLDALRTVSLDDLLDLACVIGGVLDDVLAHLLLAAAEQQVVAREIRMPEHVRGHQDVFRESVALGEVGMARVAGEHHLEQPRVPHVALDQLIDIAHAE